MNQYHNEQIEITWSKPIKINHINLFFNSLNQNILNLIQLSLDTIKYLSSYLNHCLTSSSSKSYKTNDNQYRSRCDSKNRGIKTNGDGRWAPWITSLEEKEGWRWPCKGPITRTGPGTRKNDTLWCDVRTGKGSRRGTRTKRRDKNWAWIRRALALLALRGGGEKGARWGPFALSNLLQYFQSSAAYSRSVSARFFAPFVSLLRDPLGQITNVAILVAYGNGRTFLAFDPRVMEGIVRVKFLWELIGKGGSN